MNTTLTNRIRAQHHNLMLPTIRAAIIVLISGTSLLAFGSDTLTLTNTFSTRGRQNAHGVDLSVNYPEDWIAKDGTDGIVLQVFKPRSPSVPEACVLAIEPIPFPPSTVPPVLTEDDLKELFDENGLAEYAPPGVNFHSGKQQMIAGHMGAKLEYSRNVAAGTLYTVHYVFYVKGKLVHFRCAIARLSGSPLSAGIDRFATAKRVYQSMIDSIVIRSDPSMRSIVESGYPSTPASYETWNTISIPGICTYQIPPTMEIQGGNYKALNDTLREVAFNEKSPDRVVAQPKGINSFDPQALEKYCRIIVNTTRGRAGEFDSIGTQIAPSKEELSEIDEMLKKETLQGATMASSTGAKVSMLSWNPVKIVRVNGIDTIVASFTRSTNGGPPVAVKVYSIQNNDYLHTITISYRLSEEDLWAKDLAKVIGTFKFEKR